VLFGLLQLNNVEIAESAICILNRIETCPEIMERAKQCDYKVLEFGKEISVGNCYLGLYLL